jgi:tripartite-type tricarboxylate transporter receptor subunit TctC
MNMKTVAAAVLAAACGWTATAATAAPGYPERPVQILVPYPPGGITDIVARIIAENLTKTLGQTFLVENRPGAGGMTGSDAVAKSPADGYTVLMGSVANTTFPAVNRKVPYDLVNDLTPLCRVMSVPNYLVVGVDTPYKTVADLIAGAKARPGELTFASSGPGASPHLSGELLKVMAGINIVHVPYKGSGPAFVDLIPGRVTMMFDNAAYSQVRAGKLRAIAVSTPERSPAAPDVPTVAESGVPGFSVTSWYGLWVPHGTPKAATETLKAKLKEQFSDPAMQQKMLALGGKADLLCDGEFVTFIDSELAKWKKLVVDANIKIDN